MLTDWYLLWREDLAGNTITSVVPEAWIGHDEDLPSGTILARRLF